MFTNSQEKKKETETLSPHYDLNSAKFKSTL